MDTTKETRELKLKQWAEIIHACKTSDLSDKEWMQQNNIPKHQFYYWQRQLRAQALQTMQQDENTESHPVQALVEITPSSPSRTASPVVQDALPAGTPLSIKIADAVIEVQRDATPELLRMVLQEIRHAE